MEARTVRGRPRQESPTTAALTATLELLETVGYERLRMKDVATAAHVGLGAVYRRWPSKRALVVAALQTRSDDLDLHPTDDPRADVLRVLIAVREQLLRGASFILPPLFADHESEFSRAIVEAKVEPVRQFVLERLETAVGPVADLELRADLGLAIMIFRIMRSGEPPSVHEIRTRILPRLLAEPGRSVT